MSSKAKRRAAPIAAPDTFSQGLWMGQPDLPFGAEEAAMSDAALSVAGPSVPGGGGSSRYMAMPQLMGAPAYARPPRIVAETPRPLDPDDLPIEALRSPEDEALLLAAYHPTDDQPPSLTPSSQGGLRAVAARLFGSGA